MCHLTITTTTKSLSPATEALNKALNFVQTPAINKEKPMITMKRSRTFTFDMRAFEEASKQVQESIAFPSIEWSFNDEDSEGEFAAPPAKRRCSGLVRSTKTSFDLSSLSSSGSYDSLC